MIMIWSGKHHVLRSGISYKTQFVMASIYCKSLSAEEFYKPHTSFRIALTK